LEVDLERKRISLSMKTSPDKSAKGIKAKPGREGKIQAKGKKQGKGPGPFNNPFADALKK